MKIITQYLFSKTIGKLFCFLGLYISLIVNSQAAGFVDVSALSVSPSPVTISQNFNISFSLKEYQGDSKTFEYIEVWIQDGSRSDLYNVKRWDNIAFSANQSRDFSTTTFLDPARGRVPGTYYAVVRGKLTGSDPFNFGVVPGSSASNPYRFTAIYAVGRVDASGYYLRSNDLFCSPHSQIVGIGTRNPFDVGFNLSEQIYGSKEFEYIEVWIQDGSGADLYPAQRWANEVFLPFQNKWYITSTFLDPARGRVPGQYRAIIRGKVSGSDPFNFDELIGGYNPITFTAVQRDGKAYVNGNQFYHPDWHGSQGYGNVIPQGKNLDITLNISEGGCGNAVFEYLELWIQDESGKDLSRVNRWDNVSFSYYELNREFHSGAIFIDPNKYKLGAYQAIMRGKLVGGLPFNFNEHLLAPFNVKYSVDFEVIQEQEPPPYTCKTLESGLNTCVLKPGDILFTVWKGRDFARMVGGTYWFHTGIYLGDGLIAEATGPSPIIAQNQVWTTGIDNSDWAKSKADGLLDWAVIRPIASEATKNAAVNYARSKADQGNDGNESPILFQDPNPLTNPLSDKNAEDKFYCAQLAWKSYERQGLDLETDEISPQHPWSYGLVLPDDLYYSAGILFHQSDLVAQRPGWRLLFRVFSPVDLLLVDEQGRRTGFDTTTGTILDEIPGTTYTGPESEPEAITATGVEGNLKLHVVGNKDGQYTLEAVDLDLTNIRNQVVKRDTLPGRVEIYEVVQGQEKIVIPPNGSPVANAGSDQTLVCTSPNGASVLLDGSKSSDPDDDPLTYVWTGLFGTASGQKPTVVLPLGTHTVALTVDDRHGEMSSDTVSVTVLDTIPSCILNNVSAFNVNSLRINHRLKTLFLLSNFTLGQGNNGIDPTKEPVTLTIADFTVTIPPGSFRKGLAGVYAFAGKINTISIEALIMPLGNNRFGFQAGVYGASFRGIENPIIVNLKIGGDNGTTTVNNAIIR